MPEREFDVVLYGATGYTGRLIAHELARDEARFAVAGRNADRLENLVRDLDADPDVIVASVDEPEALEAMAERTHTLASAAGPFKRLGPPVLEAALEARTHFVDTTGEQGYLRWAYETHHETAREAGVSVVNACGFDVVPTDLAAYLAADALDEPDRVEIALYTNSRLSDGTKRTMAASTGDWWEYRDGTYKNAVPGRYVRRFSFPDRAEPSTGVFIPWGDVATAHRSTGAQHVRTFFILPEKQARRYQIFWPLQALLTKIPYLDRFLEARAPDEHGGPSPEARSQARFKILAEAETQTGEQARSLVEGQDPYGLTAAATSRFAQALAHGEGPDPGVWTPVEAFDPPRLQKMLDDFGLEGTLLASPEQA